MFITRGELGTENLGELKILAKYKKKVAFSFTEDGKSSQEAPSPRPDPSVAGSGVEDDGLGRSVVVGGTAVKLSSQSQELISNIYDVSFYPLYDVSFYPRRIYLRKYFGPPFAAEQHSLLF